MNKYELMVILSNSIADEEKEALVAKIQGMVEANKGTVDSIEKVGVKKYAYKINFKNEGYYVLMNITCNSNVPNLIQNQLNIVENVIRSMFVKKESK